MANITPLKYDITISPISTASNTPANTNSIQFLNQGTSTVLINNLLRIPPNGSWGVDGNYGEIDTTIYSISFDTTGIPAPVNKVLVIRKNYKVVFG